MTSTATYNAVPLPSAGSSSPFSSLVELSSDALGSTVVDVSDDFFAAASNLLSVHPAVNMKGQFGPNGALFDGWESRRHNRDHDWVIIKLGALGTVEACDIDTRHFNGNESPASEVFGANVSAGASIDANSPLWKPLLPLVPLSPASQHLFTFPSSNPLTHLKLTMHPDGGIGRFRAYGHIIPSPSATSTYDLAHVLAGGRVVDQSDKHFGEAGNLILPGRGKDMGDGWETKRSRGRKEGEGDWVVVRLAEPAHVEWVDLDTRHFLGNFPHSAAVFGTFLSDEKDLASATWTQLLSPQRMSAHKHHIFPLTSPETPVSHVKVAIYPDGGLKRVRVYGRPVAALAKEGKSFAEAERITKPVPDDGFDEVEAEQVEQKEDQGKKKKKWGLW